MPAIIAIICAICAIRLASHAVSRRRMYDQLSVILHGPH